MKLYSIEANSMTELLAKAQEKGIRKDQIASTGEDRGVFTMTYYAE